MAETMFVKPANPAIKVRRSDTLQHLPERGDRVPRDSYWLRRIVDGDVVEVSEPPSQDAKA